MVFKKIFFTIKKIFFTIKKINSILQSLFFINFLFTIKKIFLYVCVTKHFLFGHVIILEFLG